MRELWLLGFSWVKIADRLSISRRTLYRRLEGSNLMGFTDITGTELDSLISTCYKETHPNDGEVMVTDHLQGASVRVPRCEIRESIHRIHPLGTAQRTLTTVKRRNHYVEAPNKVWHMDGNHKLIRWKFVIHGAVDGYSRVIVMLKCSTNNRTGTVLAPFLQAVSVYGLPSKLRTDRGGENVDAWQYMIQRHGRSDCVIDCWQFCSQ